ncbi:MAG: HD domain-containing protein [Candidatus Nealsonbacteria bacterium]
MIIPKEIKSVLEKLEKKGFEAYLVGGCVRDLLLNKKPKDWDITTNAKPKEIEKIFPKNFSDNNFGTVGVLTGSKDKSLEQVEITPFRTEEKYTDKRHPDKVEWAKTIEEDLSRRDFTINSIALKNQKNKSKSKIIDLFEGEKDLNNKIIRTVGKADDRFEEDALRMLRAVRFAVVFNFEIEKKTAEAIKKNSYWLKMISKERIRDELLKIIMSDYADKGIELLRELKLLQYIIPELEENYKVGQNKHHIYDCYEHALFSLKYAVKKKFNKHVRLSALLHDIAKPRVKEGEGSNSTFYNHEIVGAKMTIQILNRLRFSKKDIEKVTKLVRYHLFYYNVDEVGEASVRRLVRKVGIESMEELLQVRMADRIGSGVPKAEPYKLRHLKYLIEKVSQDPISVKTLKVNGKDVMKILDISPSQKIGQILDVLFGYVLSDPEKNKKDFLEKEIEKLGKLSEKELKEKSEQAKKERQNIEIKKDKMTKDKYWVT